MNLGLIHSKKDTSNIALPTPPKPIVTPSVHHQIELLTEEKNLNALWNIKHYSHMASKAHPAMNHYMAIYEQ